MKLDDAKIILKSNIIQFRSENCVSFSVQIKAAEMILQNIENLERENIDLKTKINQMKIMSDIPGGKNE